jgi:phosphatidylglycerophosphate synthase
LFLVAVGSYFLHLKAYLLSFVFLLLGALCDALDGAIARKTKRNSPFGAFLDSLTDRFSDALPFIAIALSSQDKVLSFFSLLALVFSFGVSYARARAEGLGFELRVGFFERTERWVVLLSGCSFTADIFGFDPFGSRFFFDPHTEGLYLYETFPREVKGWEG